MGNPTALIIGAGIGGISAAIHLRRAGFKVRCIDPGPQAGEPLGESFDFSMPKLIDHLGLDHRDIIPRKIGTYKDCLRVSDQHGHMATMRAWPMLNAWPFKLQEHTYHVDRRRFGQWLIDHAQTLGVEFLTGRVATCEFEADRLVHVTTREGEQLRADWFIDASGRARLFGRAREIEREIFSPQKVTMWTQLPLEYDGVGGTSLYTNTDSDSDSDSGYLEWLWEIPLDETRASIGYTMSAARMRELRSAGMSKLDIFRAGLAKFWRFTDVELDDTTKLSTCSFSTYTHERACGDNWFMVGEAAALPDPITAGGTTAAMRNAESASRQIIAARRRGCTSARQRRFYDRDASELVAHANIEMERYLYEAPLRQTRGLYWATRNYFVAGFTPVNLYARIGPKSQLGLHVLNASIALCRRRGERHSAEVQRDYARPDFEPFVETKRDLLPIDPKRSSLPPAGSPRELIEQFSRLLAGELPMYESRFLLAPRPIMHVNGFSMPWSPAGWRAYITFLRRRSRLRNLSGIVDEIVDHGDGTLSIIGRWTGTVRGSQVTAQVPSEARYRVEDGRIVEIWSKTKNYVELLPFLRLKKLGLPLLIIYYQLWTKVIYQDPLVSQRQIRRARPPWWRRALPQMLKRDPTSARPARDSRRSASA